MPEADPHTLLGLSPDASTSDVIAAYRRLARIWHPDVTDDPAAAQRFAALNAAYQRLLAAATTSTGAVIPIHRGHPAVQPPLVAGPVQVTRQDDRRRANDA